MQGNLNAMQKAILAEVDRVAKRAQNDSTVAEQTEEKNALGLSLWTRAKRRP